MKQVTSISADGVDVLNVGAGTVSLASVDRIREKSKLLYRENESDADKLLHDMILLLADEVERQVLRGLP